jgi:hypothetical protein
MQPMSHDTAAAAALGIEAAATGTQGLTATSAASTAITGLAPAGADEVSAQAATAFAAEGTEAVTQINTAQEEIIRAGEAFTTIAGMYAALDDGAAGTLE